MGNRAVWRTHLWQQPGIIMCYRTKDYLKADRMLPPFGVISAAQVAQIYRTLPSIQGTNSHFVISLYNGLLMAKQEIDQTPNTFFYPGGIPMNQPKFYGRTFTRLQRFYSIS